MNYILKRGERYKDKGNIILLFYILKAITIRVQLARASPRDPTTIFKL
jgi:hypothetical protein